MAAETTKEQYETLEQQYDRHAETVANVQMAILKDMNPRDIAEMIAVYFDDAPEDVLDTAQALVQQFVSMGYTLQRDGAHEWADKAFGV